MRGKAPIEVDLTATRDGVAVSLFVQPTRGIVFEVTSEAGKAMSPAEPIMGSPFQRPLGIGQLVSVTKGSPYRIVTGEGTATIFPVPERYRVKARIYLFSSPSDPVRYAQLSSDPITVDVVNY